ncbi:MAG: DUF5011 domain-containing protein [Bacteroidia bacterium]|nr:DUF5011 domain-containing protein [Bacteroidia bacterium]
MKKSITSSLIKVLGGGFAAILSLLPGSAGAQYCSATSWGNGTTYAGNIVDLTVANGAGTLASYASMGNNTSVQVLNSGSPFDITAGEQLTVTVTGTTDAYGYSWSTNVGVWVDADQDKTFSGAECVVDPQSGPLTGVTSTPKSATFSVPCFKTAGASRMRFRGSSSSYSSYMCKTGACGGGCNGGSTYGNQFDLEVNLKLGTAPTADFTVPTGPNYEKAFVTFNATNPNTYFTYLWNFNPPGTAGPGSPVSAIGAKAKSKWNTPNTYDVKLVVDYCGLKDSITKTVKIIAPTAAPKADFIASSNLVEIYFDVQLFDLSTNGPWKWAWEVTSPTGNAYNFSSQNPVITMDEEGKWDVCLTSENGVGPSNKVCKSKYVECTPPSEFYMGPNKLGTNKNGTLFDNGGPGGNYGNNRKVTIDYFKILPCGAKEIRLKFASLKLANSADKLRVYDGSDESGILLTPGGISSTNQGTYRNGVLKAYSGAMYITFESDGSGNDSGFIATWESDLLAPVPPTAKWTTDYNPAANGMDVEFDSDVDGQGAVTYEWIVDQNPYMGFNPEFNYTFTTDGTYEVCVAATTCNGSDTFCDNITIVTPTKAGALDYTASNLRPKVGEVVKLTTTTDYANTFEWSIFPLTYTWVSGGANARNPEIKFTAGGAYTFTLKAWNSVGGQVATEKKLIKNKYVVVLDYCTPPVDLLSSDVGINRVMLNKGATNLLDNESDAGMAAYTDYSEIIKKPTLTYGASYDVAVSRKTNSNTANYKVWVDFNIDGDFVDAGELVLNSGTIAGTDAMGTFTVPDLVNSFEGATRMRVGVSYGNFSNTPCGVNIVGEFEDYGIILANDNLPPIITLTGADTIRVEKGSTANSCYAEVAGVSYMATDPTEGNLTNDVVVVTDLDCTVPGIYSYEFNVSDASGNKAVTRRRTVIVVLDKTAPVITLNGTTPMTVEQCDNFTDPGAVATDAVDGNLTTAIITTGSVNSSATGSYTLTYTISDAQGNTSSVNRVVNVVDTKKPGLFLRGNRIVNNSIINVQINSTFVDEIYGDDVCNGAIPVTKTPGFNGPVNTIARATYPISYFAADPSGNKADEDGFVLNYRVDDYIAPIIVLNTDDTILHDVNTPYVSRQVTASDNYYSLDKVSVVKSGSVDAYTLGTYKETYTATDESGNTTVKVRTVKVVDREAPSILAPAVNACVGTPFWAYSGLVIRDNYYSPASLLPLVKVLNHNVNIWEAGVYYINYELSDPSGNQAALVSRPVFVDYAPGCQNTYTSIENIKLEDAVSIFPNPTRGEVTIGYTLSNNEALNIVVTNIAGQVVTEMNGLKGGFGNTKIDLSNYGSGTYIVRLTNNGESITRKIVVAN